MTHRDMRAPGRRLMLVDVESGACRELAPRSAKLSLGQSGEPAAELSGEQPGAAAPKPSPVPFDPWQIACDWPDRWRDYLHAHFASHTIVAVMFDVSEPAARKWWTGVGSCRADKAAMAVAMHPRSAPQMLYGIAAE